MKQNLREVFKNIEEIAVDPKLESLILSKIEFLKERKIKRTLILSQIGLVSSFSIFFLALFKYSHSFIRSDFWDLSRLFFTDTLVVSGNWDDFIYSLLETLPAVHLIMILVPVFIMSFSFSVYSKSIYRNHHRYI